VLDFVIGLALLNFSITELCKPPRCVGPIISGMVIFSCRLVGNLMFFPNVLSLPFISDIFYPTLVCIFKIFLSSV